MKKIIVTGANGMLGQDLCPILEKNGYEVFKTDIDNMDITDIQSAEKVIGEQKPDIVIHAAAYTNVDGAEENVEIATKINVTGTENIAKVCAKNDITMVYISTDYVFDGEENKIHYPDDKTNPLSVYGRTKRQGELAVCQYCTKYYIARTAWLYGIHGKNFVETIISLSGKPELKVVDDQIGCPTWTVELSNGIVKLLKEKDYGIYHVCGGGQTSWYGFTKEIFRLAGINANLKPCTTDEFPRPAKRPKFGVMDNGGLCRPWQDALKDYIELRKGV